MEEHCSRATSHTCEPVCVCFNESIVSNTEKLCVQVSVCACLCFVCEVLSSSRRLIMEEGVCRHAPSPASLTRQQRQCTHSHAAQARHGSCGSRLCCVGERGVKVCAALSLLASSSFTLFMHTHPPSFASLSSADTRCISVVPACVFVDTFHCLVCECVHECACMNK